MELTQTRAEVRAGRPIWLLGALLGAGVAALVAAAIALGLRNGYATGELLFIASEPLAAAVGGLVIARQPRNPVGWLIVGHALCFTLGELSRQYALFGVVTSPGALPFARAAAWPAYWLWGPGIVFGFALLPMHFPDGRLVSPRWRPARWFVVVGMSAVTLNMAFRTGDWETPGVPNPLGLLPALPEDAPLMAVFGGLWLASALIGVASLFVRFARAGRDERRQLQWLALSAAVLIAGDRLVPASSPLSAPLFLASLTGMWLAIGVAVLRYRLYDIDLILNRALVYGALSAIVAGLYIALVAYLGALFNASGNLLIALVATGVVAVAFQPLRERLQRGVNRLLYGARDEPYAVLALLGRRLEASLAPAAALGTIVETVAQTLKLPYAAIVLGEADEPAAVAPPGAAPPAEAVALPLVYQGEPVGELHVAPRAGESGLSPADRRLLDDLARQVGVAVSAARLTVDLQHARERLVAAREEERRRMRRDLHDGLGPALAAQTLKLGTARHFLATDPAVTDRLLGELERDVAAALADVRRLVYNLRPPALDDLGLAGALGLLAAQYGGDGGAAAGLRVTVDAADLPPLPAAVEVAAYRIAQEALANVARHAGAARAEVRLAAQRGLGRHAALLLEIADDGRGIAAGSGGGVGLHSMRERAAELGGSCVIRPRPGGGTVVQAALPLPQEGS
jgi:signal transduction histidine kinase